VNMTTSRALRIRADRLTPFEPAHLGAKFPDFERVVDRIDGLPQSGIRAILEQEVERRRQASDDVESNALLVTLLVLRDYVIAGHYPLVSRGRVYLASLLDSESLDDLDQREALRRRYQVTRDRALRERGQIDWLRTACSEVGHRGSECWCSPWAYSLHIRPRGNPSRGCCWCFTPLGQDRSSGTRSSART
jgi:hypothetical protein